MIEFKCKYTRRDYTPIVTDLAIQDYAEAILADYQPALLERPGRIDGLHFLEYYLGLTVDFLDIYCPEGSKIAGATVFNDENVLAFDREHECISAVPEKAGTVLLDNETMRYGNFAVFTQLHEAGHYCMHKDVYTRSRGDRDDLKLGHTVQCTRNVIGESHKQLVTNQDFREHQANTFAAALAMPRPAFVPKAQQLLESIGQNCGFWFIPDWDNPEFDYYHYEDVIWTLASAFGVSRRAVTVQLYRQGIYRTLHANRIGQSY